MKQLPHITILLALILLVTVSTVQTAPNPHFNTALPELDAPQFVADLRPGTYSSEPGYPLIVANNKLFFRSTHPGDQPAKVPGFWASDGTESGTINLKPSYPASIIAAEDRVYAELGGEGLWVSDGTITGTQKINFPSVAKPAAPTACVPAPYITVGTMLFTPYYTNLWRTDGTDEGTIQLVTFDGGICTAAAVADTFFFNHLNEVWKSDGTVAGTSLVATIPDDAPRDTSLQHFTSSGDRLFFVGPDSQLWRSDGTAAGTVMVAELDGNTSFMRGGNGRIFFVQNNIELWQSDGTAAGTQLILNADEPIHPDLTPIDDLLYFTTQTGMWQSDGTPTGTQKLKESLYGTASTSFIPFNDLIYFRAKDEETGMELWRTDGTPEGTELAIDLEPGEASSTPLAITLYNGQLYFFATQFGDRELWRSDGTPAGTELVKDITNVGLSAAPANFTRFNDEQFLITSDPAEANHFDVDTSRLWISNGTEAGTEVIWEGRASKVGHVEEILVADGTAYFIAGNWDVYSSVWKSDGTAAGTSLLIDFSKIGNGALIRHLRWFKDKLYFSADTLWQSDGTVEGTMPLKADELYLSSEVVATQDLLFFWAQNNERDVELWRSDGTEAGTYRTKDIHPNESDRIGSMFNLDNTLLFTANDGQHGHELWRSDGSEAGTVMIKDIHPTDDAQIEHMTPFNNMLLFVANDGEHGEALWRSDGTADGTVLVHELGGETAVFDIQSIVAAAEWVYLLVDADGEKTLWRSDGTAAGTVQLKQFTECRPSFRQLYVVGNTLYGPCTTTGQTLWASDGTAAGTKLLATFYPDEPEIRLTNFGQGLGYLFFEVDQEYTTPEHPISISQLWRSDGTIAGTVLVQDFAPDIAAPPAPRIEPVGEVNGRLYFGAYAGIEKGVELWTIEPVSHKLYLPFAASSH